MESCVRNRQLLATAAMAAAYLINTHHPHDAPSTTSIVVDGFTMPHSTTTTTHKSTSKTSSSFSSALGVSVGLGEIDEKKNPIYKNPYDPNRIILDEDGSIKPHIVDFEPYRQERMQQSDKNADEWFGTLLHSNGGGGDDDSLFFLGSISQQHKDRLVTPVELHDEPVLTYGEDEEWTPYVSRRLPTSPLYPAYGLETYGLPILRRGAEAWRHYDVNSLVAIDYSTVPEGIGSDYTISGDGDSSKEDIINSLKGKGVWLDDIECAGRLVYVNGMFCPELSMETDDVKNLDSSHFNGGSVSDETLEYLARLPDGFTDKLAAEVPDESRGPLTSHEQLSGPDHCVGKATSQFAINNQQGTAAFAALNSVKAGCVAYVEGNSKDQTKPALIINAQTPSGGCGSGTTEGGKGVAFHPRTLAVARDGSLLSLVQLCVDLDDNDDNAKPCATLVNGYTQIFVGANANVTHSFLEESGGTVTPRVEMSNSEVTADKSISENPRDVESRRPALRNTNLQAIDVHITGDDGSYESSLMELGGQGRSRIAISTSLLRPGAHAAINGFALSGGAQRSDMRTSIHHMAQGTTSRQEQRNMVGGRSTASFRGRIRVEQSAQQTDSEQLSRTILLSDHARIWATPSLEIIADDVQCTHGATVSDLSEEELFYLRSRGLDSITSRNLLMYAFVEEIGNSVDKTIAGGFDDESGLRQRIIRRLENLVPEGKKTLVGGEFQSV